MADATEKKKTKAKEISEWRNRPPDTPAADEQAKKQREVWSALHEFICANGGWVTSRPHYSLLRIEAPQGSPLPAKLVELGYSVRMAGTATRLVPNASAETVTEYGPARNQVVRHHPGFVPVNILEITLPRR
jgi:hypothetical protein